MEILPGKTIQLRSGADTLWVINNVQMQKSITQAMSLVKADSIFNMFQAEIYTLQKVISRKNDIIKQNKEGYDKFKGLWESSTKELEEEEEKVEKAKRKNKIWTGVGFVSGAAIMFVISSFL